MYVRRSGIIIRFFIFTPVRVKWGNLERPCKSSVNGNLQVKFSVCNVSVN